MDNPLLKPLAGLHITARRWFAKSAGNTYHSVEIHANGGMVARSWLVVLWVVAKVVLFVGARGVTCGRYRGGYVHGCKVSHIACKARFGIGSHGTRARGGMG